VIQDNQFEKNQAGFALFESQKLSRASVIFINGGSQYNQILDNRFYGHEAIYYSYMLSYAENLFKYMRPDYFIHEQAPLI
jgi:hypothetical protein